MSIGDSSLGWNIVPPGHASITVIPGTHEAMARDPNVQILAAATQDAIRESQV